MEYYGIAEVHPGLLLLIVGGFGDHIFVLDG